MEVSEKICLFAPNSYCNVNHRIAPCCGNVKLNIIVDMINLISSTGFDSNGNPCNYKDKDDTIWIYIGKSHGIEEWRGIPNEN